MRLFTSLLLFMLNCMYSFALNIRDVDLYNNNSIGSIIADSVLLLFLILFCVYFAIRIIHIAFKKKYTFEKETALARDKAYLKKWLACKKIVDNSYVSTTMAEIYAFECMRSMEEEHIIKIVQPGEKYVKCGLNIFSEYQMIRLIEDNKNYYMHSN